MRPNVTVSRRPWSGGEELARQLADRLGWELFDRQIVDALHQDDALGKSVLEALDERLLGLREDWMYHLFVPGHMSTTAYVQRLSELVFSIAMRGHNVFLGRGASFIVPRDWRLAVLVTRGFETRVTRCMEALRIGHDAARREVAALDRTRADFVARSFRRDVDDPASHDLCLNLDSMSVEAGADVLIQALALRFPQTTLQQIG